MRRVVTAAVRHRRLTLLAWLVIVAVSVVAAPESTEVATYDDNAFLPSGAAALRGDLVEEGWPDDDFTSSAVVVLLRHYASVMG